MAKTNYLFLFVFLLAVLLPYELSGQSAVQHSYFGNVHTPQGRLHVLFIFVRYEGRDYTGWRDIWPDVSEEGVLPRVARGQDNDLVSAEIGQLGTPRQKRNLSDYYFTMSGGKFLLTGEIFPIQVPVKFIHQTAGNNFSRQRQMNQQAIEWIAENYPDFDWSRFDRRSNRPGYRYDNASSRPDSILDYVVFMHRFPGSTGMGSSGNFDIPGTVYRVQDGHTGIASYADPEHNWEYFKHEFAHNLYDCPHYLGANNADGDKFYTNKGWGMMAAWHSPFFTANAWECWWMGWLEPVEVTTSGRYELPDMITGRRAIKIPLPGGNDNLWLENHQKRNRWDEKVFFRGPEKGYPQSAPGLYASVVASPGADRESPHLNPFNYRHANLIKMLNAEGNFDYRFTGDSMKTEYLNTPLLEKVAENPLAGQNDFQFIRLDYNRDEKIDVGRSHGNSDRGGVEQCEVWTEYKEGKGRYSLNSTGDSNDAFQPGMTIGLNGIVPALNYPVYDRSRQQFEPLHINPISVEVVDRNPDGTLVLDIDLRDTLIRKNQRWCGNLILEASPSTPLSLVTERKVDIVLDQSGTPDRLTPHPETGLFANPTQLLIGERGNLTLGVKSEMTVRENSELTIARGGVLNLQRKASLVVRSGSTLAVAEGGRLTLDRGASLIIEPGATFKVAEGATFELNPRSKTVGL